MMVTKNEILKRLPVFKNDVVVIKRDQTVQDIMAAMKKFHRKYFEQYDEIANLFLGATGEQTCKNIFNFLKQSAFYHIESKEAQSVRSPAAIVATGSTIGIDCKNYSLFIGGVLDAINRTGVQNIPFLFRYASYNLFDKTPAHVFIVAYPDTKKELWIDPVLKSFNLRTPEPISFIDKKFSTMLHGISGTPVVFETANNSVVGTVNKLFKIENAAIGSGLFANLFAAPKRTEELYAMLDKVAPAFLYLYLDVDNPAVMALLPPIVKDKWNKANAVCYDFGAQGNFDHRTEFLPRLRQALTTQLGKTPEQYWNDVLHTNIIRQFGVAGLNIDAKTSAAALNTINTSIPGASAVTSIVSSLFPGLKFKFPIGSFAPDASDWIGFKYNPFTPPPTSISSLIGDGKKTNWLLYGAIAFGAYKLLPQLLNKRR